MYRKIMTYLCLFSSVLLSGLAQITLKLGMTNFGSITGFTEKILYLAKNGYFWGGLFLYGFSMILRLYVLSKFDLSYAYPFVAVSYIVVLIGGYFLGETITTLKILGIIMILIGIILIAKG